MQSIVAVVGTVEDARRVARSLVADLPAARVSILTPTTSTADLAAMPTDDAEQPGMGSAIGAVAGGAAGAAAATFLVPPVGAIAVIGLAAAALLGGLGGGAVGHAVEESGAYGLPKDELFVYADALRNGRYVVAAFVEDDDDVETARRVMAAGGVESIDAAREEWWVGLRDAEEAAYGDAEGFATHEPRYRDGFETACRGEQTAANGDEPFRAGYARGRRHIDERAREIVITRPAIVDAPRA
jgi:hypothetical protein